MARVRAILLRENYKRVKKRAATLMVIPALIGIMVAILIVAKLITLYHFESLRTGVMYD